MRTNRTKLIYALLLASWPVIEADRGARHRRTRQAIERVADLYRRWGREQDARSFLERLAAAGGPVDIFVVSDVTGG